MNTETLSYFNQETLPAGVWNDKYALHDENDNVVEKTPDDMHWRLANEFARIEQKKFKKPYTAAFLYDLFKNFSCIIPQGSPMFGIGNPYQTVSLSNCYVLTQPLDSYNSILAVDKELVNIAKRRGGNGIDLSNLRPAGTKTNNAAKSSTGVISFAERYSNSTREVGQKNRRGALMLTLDVHHPESIHVSDDETEIVINDKMEHLGVRPIKTKKKYYDPQNLDFCSMKLDRTKVTGANVTIKFTNEFLNAVDKKIDYEQRWPINSANPKIRKMVSAVKAWEKFVHCSWQSAEPGVSFWDRVIEESPADCYAKYGYNSIGLNPCGELILCALDSCRLLIQNLLFFVHNAFLPTAYFDFKDFVTKSKIAQRLMDDLIDLELECIDKIIAKIDSDPEPTETKRDELELWTKIKDKCARGRRTGLGITALGDMLAALNIKYGSEESIKVSQQVYRALKLAAYESSVDMAEELGPFEVFDHSLERDNPFLNRFKQEKVLAANGEALIDGAKLYARMAKSGRRNISLLTTAPVGSTSILARASFDDTGIINYGTSSGIEPVFMLEYKRRRKCHEGKTKNASFTDQQGDSWEEYAVYHPTVNYWMRQTGETDITKSPWWKATANDIDWINRVKLQAAIGMEVDHSISSTLNLPNDVKEETISEIFLTAWKYGCKGITVYRDGCRSGVLVSKDDDANNRIQKTQAPKRPKKLLCDIYHVSVQKEKYNVVVGLLNKEPYEVFAVKSKKDFDAKQGFLTKNRRGEYKLEDEQENIILENVSEKMDESQEAATRLISTSLRHGVDTNFLVGQLEKIEGGLHSFTAAIARCLKRYIPDGTKISGESCPDCGDKLLRISGCVQCGSCSYGKCA